MRQQQERLREQQQMRQQQERVREQQQERGQEQELLLSYRKQPGQQQR